MTIQRLLICVFLCGSFVAAQEAPCHSGPGAAFGITTFQCERCEFFSDAKRPRQLFHTPPVVTDTSAESKLRSGDVIEAVNGKPVTTPEGSELLAYPPIGEAALTVRRGGKLIEVRMPALACPTSEPGHQPPPSQPAKSTRTDPADTGRFGLALACKPSCTRVRGGDGVEVYKYDAAPPIVAIAPGSPAEAAGLLVGDVVAEVDGRSLTTVEGARRFAEAEGQLHITVLRQGRRMSVVLESKQ